MNDVEPVQVEADLAFIHEGRQYRRGDRLDVSKSEALDLQALAIAHIVVEKPEADGAEPTRPVRTGSKNRYLRRDQRRGSET